MKSYTRFIRLLAAAALTTACGSTPDTRVTIDPKTRSYTVVGVRYTPTLAKACGDAHLTAPTFEFDSAALTAPQRTELGSLAACVRRDTLAAETLYVVGHADPRGTAEYNRDLGRERAESVRQALIASGVAASRIKVESHGEQGASMQPWDWPEDRRVDIGITEGGKWSYTQTEMSDTTPGKTVQGVFAEREDLDGDGIPEPGVYPVKTAPAEPGDDAQEP